MKPCVVKKHTALVWTLAFSPDGKTMASGSADNNVVIWDVPTGQDLMTLRHNGGIEALRFSPDGQLLATAAHERCAARFVSGTLRPMRTRPSTRYGPRADRRCSIGRPVSIRPRRCGPFIPIRVQRRARDSQCASWQSDHSVGNRRSPTLPAPRRRTTATTRCPRHLHGQRHSRRTVARRVERKWHPWCQHGHQPPSHRTGHRVLWVTAAPILPFPCRPAGRRRLTAVLHLRTVWLRPAAFLSPPVFRTIPAAAGRTMAGGRGAPVRIRAAGPVIHPAKEAALGKRSAPERPLSRPKARQFVWRRTAGPSARIMILWGRDESRASAPRWMSGGPSA